MLIGILGSGRFGTALALSLASKFQVVQWVRNECLYRHILTYRENITYAPNYKYPDNIKVVNSLEEFSTFIKNQIVISALPTQVSFEIWKFLKDYDFKPKYFICASKGIDLKQKDFLSNLFKSIYKDIYYFALSGPSFSRLILEKKPTNLVLAGENKDLVLKLIKILSTYPLHLYGSLDLMGVQIGGALKNVYAIAAGICDGLNLGENAKAALITRSIKEMIRFASKFGADPKTLNGLSGMGDLVLSSYSTLSRNYSLGYLIGKLKRFPTKRELDNYFGKNTIEGIATTKVVYQFKHKYNLYMPILESLYNFIYENTPLDNLIERLIFREPKMEFD